MTSNLGTICLTSILYSAALILSSDLNTYVCKVVTSLAHIFVFKCSDELGCRQCISSNFIFFAGNFGDVVKVELAMDRAVSPC